MAAADRGNSSSLGSCGSANLFSPSGLSMAKCPDFLQAFGIDLTNINAIEPPQAEKPVNGDASVYMTAGEPPYFDFDPSSNTGSPFQNQSLFGISTDGLPGLDGYMNFRPLSPSSSDSPLYRDSIYSVQGITDPSNILTKTQLNHTHPQNGQVTPPNSDEGRKSLLNYELPGLHRLDNRTDLPINKKRMRNDRKTKGSATTTAVKRTRKSASHKSGSYLSETSADPKGEEDARRRKFLERNRVAASKCRQKRKEWILDLENRGRELQKGNKSLRLIVNNLRREMLFLRGEIQKHNGCDCTQIHHVLKSGTIALPALRAERQDELRMKRETSPLENIPRSRKASVVTAVSDGQIAAAKEVERLSNAEIAVDENTLEALLASSIGHETSEGGGIKSELQHTGRRIEWLCTRCQVNRNELASSASEIDKLG